MRPILLFLLSSIVIVTGGYSQGLQYVQGELLVQLNDERSFLDFKEDYDSRYGLTYEQVTTIPFDIKRIIFDFAEINEHELLRILQSDQRVRFVQFNHLIEERNIPNDPEFSNQWQYLQDLGSNGNNADIDADLAWDITTGGLTALGDTIVACIIDDGLNTEHEDFGDNIWFNHGEIPENGIDDDSNGYIDDFRGWDVYNDSDNIINDGSHGTPVTGIIGAKGNNDIGVAGVNWDVKLMVVRGGGNEANALASYAYPYYFRKLYNETAGAQGAFVVVTNASWGTNYGQPEDAPIWCNFYDALGEEGIISCGATANLNINVDQEGDLPTGCGSEFLISVTNMNRNDEKETNAGYGLQSIDLGAFGSGTWTTNVNNSYSGFGGTSGATPHVAGCIALLYSSPCDEFASLTKQDPALGAFLAKQYVLNGVEPNETLQGITQTGGRLNLNNSILNVMTDCISCPISTNIEFSDANLDGLTVSWDQSTESQSVNIRFKSDIETDWTIIEDVTSPYQLSGLETCTNYSVELQSVCDTVSNVYFGNYFFKSEGCCEFKVDEDLEIVDEDVEIIITIPEVIISSQYVLEYKSINDNIWLSASANENRQVILNDLDECTSYEMRIQLVCQGNESDYFYFDNYTTSCDDCTQLEYCDSPFVDNEFEWIAEIAFNQDTFQSEASINGYQNLIGNKTFAFRQDEYIDLSLTPGFLNSSYDEIWKVWIDYDKDGEFNEDIELVYQSEALSDSTNIGEFKVPSNAELGYTRMRIIMCYNGPTISCGDDNLEYGEVADCCVFIDEESGINTTRLLNIEMSPQPAEGFITLRNVFEPGELQIFTNKGQLKLTRSLSGIGNHTIPLGHDLGQGIYFVVYNTQQGSWSEKLIKI